MNSKGLFQLPANLLASVAGIMQTTPETSPPSDLEAWTSPVSGTQTEAEKIQKPVAYLYNGNRERSKMHKALVFWVAGVATLFIFPGKSVRAGSRPAPHGKNSELPTRGDAVPVGTHVLVRLSDELRTDTDKVNKKFKVKTLEPLETTNGYFLAPGAKVRGHISRIEKGGLTGHARLWLTFDDIDTQHGRLAIVAEVSSVPGDFGVRSGESREGEIEARTGNGTRALEAAAAGAAAGAAPGVAAHNVKAAAMGAATGGAAALVAASSGAGQEIDLPKGTKLDLILDRSLYLNQ
jgi:hypothetical protein